VQALILEDEIAKILIILFHRNTSGFYNSGSTRLSHTSHVVSPSRRMKWAWKYKTKSKSSFNSNYSLTNLGFDDGR
jgi:hypothetical protein